MMNESQATAIMSHESELAGPSSATLDMVVPARGHVNLHIV